MNLALFAEHSCFARATVVDRGEGAKRGRGRGGEGDYLLGAFFVRARAGALRRSLPSSRALIRRQRGTIFFIDRCAAVGADDDSVERRRRTQFCCVPRVEGGGKGGRKGWRGSFGRAITVGGDVAWASN